MHNNQLTALSAGKAQSLVGEVTVPGDKSISHRTLILASQAVGRTSISGLLEGDDVLKTAQALRQLGVNIEQDGDVWLVDGVGVGGLSAPSAALDMGNSGTAARLLMGLVAPYDFETQFIGDESLSKRPMGRVINPLIEMGVEIISNEAGTFPLTIVGSRSLAPIRYTSPVASAQLKSCIMLAALNIAGKTTIIEKTATRDHTEKMMRYLGVEVAVESGNQGGEITITGQAELIAKDFIVPCDPSSAAFLVVAGLLVPNSCICVRDVMTNPSRFGLYQTLQEMGADLQYTNRKVIAGEEVVDITARTSQLHGVDVPAQRAASMIDEYPILAIAAACSEGQTKMNDLHELRVKESDRLQAIYDGLIANGVDAQIEGDDLIINGGEIAGGAIVTTHMDHRIAMSFLIAGLVANEKICVDDGSMIKTSFPNFIELINSIGGEIGK